MSTFNPYKVLNLIEKDVALLSHPAQKSIILRRFAQLSKKFAKNKNDPLKIKELEEAKLALLKTINVTRDSTVRAKNMWLNQPPQHADKVVLDGKSVSVDDVISVARFEKPISLTNDKDTLDKINASCEYIINSIELGRNIYGVTTSFGGLAHIRVTKEITSEMQNNLVSFLQAGTGNKLSIHQVRASMMVRANSLLYGASGIRLMLIQRMIDLINLKLTPVVYEFGSIGASGDLIPLSSICGAMIGLNASYKMTYQGQEIKAIDALQKFNLPKIKLLPKEALAILNGTGVMTGIASDCIYQTKLLLHLSLFSHSLLLQAIGVSNQPFDDFIHRLKPYPGQIWTAKKMLALFEGSKLIKNEMESELDRKHGQLIQDRYSSRCLPQYTGAIVDGLESIVEQIEIEINSVTDNPLIDTERQISLHGGNFLGLNMGACMDQLRYYIGLLAKHLDVQIATSVLPEFSNGLPPSLVGNTKRPINCGLKGLQICANSIMPVLIFYSNYLVPHYPTHAEQYNQNINSQGLYSSVLASQSVGIFQQYMAIALMFGIQAAALKCHNEFGHYDATECLSPVTAGLYKTVFEVLGKKIDRERPYIWNDDEQSLEEHIALLTNDIKNLGKIPQYIFENMNQDIFSEGEGE